jgi:hypothetical protein
MIHLSEHAILILEREPEFRKRSRVAFRGNGGVNAVANKPIHAVPRE